MKRIAPFILAALILSVTVSAAFAENQFYSASRREGYDPRFSYDRYDRYDHYDRNDRWDRDCGDDRDVYIYNQYNYPDGRYSYKNDQRYPTHYGSRGRGGIFYGERPSSYAPGIGTSFPSRPNRASQKPYWR